MAKELKIKLGVLESSMFDTLQNMGYTLEERVDNKQMATVALLVWCGVMSFLGSILMAINEPGLVFAGTLIGGGLIIVAVFIDVTDLYMIWHEPKSEEPTDAEKGLNALFGDD